MRWLLSVLVVVGLAGALPLSTSAPAHACSCVYEADGPQIAEQISYAASAFTGTVTTKRIEDQVGFYEVAVREVFEGDVGAKTVVSADTLGASCGRSFEIGTEYIVFTSTSRTHGAPWSANSCSGTTQSTNERTRAAAIAVYGMPRTPDLQMNVGIDDAGKSLWWVIAGLGGAVALAIGLILWRWRFPKH